MWVAAHPPLAPFSGGKLKTRTALTLCSPYLPIHLLTFAAPETAESVQEQLTEEWCPQGIRVTVLPLNAQSNVGDALLRHQLLTTTRLPLDSALAKITELGGTSDTGLVVMDDIALAPLLNKCGNHTLFSPHDCISAMELSSLRLMPSGIRKIRQLMQYRMSLYYERNYYHKALLVHLVTNRDRKNLQDINSQCRCHVVPYRDESVERAVTQDRFTHDVIVWSDLRRDGLLQGTLKFISEALNSPLSRRRLLIVGKLSQGEALSKFRYALPNTWDYGQYLEDEQGQMRYGRITLIPDIGGAGIKSRILNTISSGDCVATLYEQMAGIDEIADVGALNSFSFAELVRLIEQSLLDGTWEQIGLTGQMMLQQQLSDEKLRDAWLGMVDRAMVIKRRLVSNTRV